MEAPIDFLNGKTLRLFNLATDPEERTNLAAEQPDLAQQLLRRLLVHAKTLVEVRKEQSDKASAEQDLAPGWCSVGE